MRPISEQFYSVDDEDEGPDSPPEDETREDELKVSISPPISYVP